MKIILLLVAVMLLIQPAFSYSKDSTSYALGVEKIYSKHSRNLTFIPGRLLEIKTREGHLLRSSQYIFTDQMIVMDAMDTVLMKDISWIKGMVYNNAERRVLGVILIGYSMLVAVSLVALTALTLDPWPIALGGVVIVVGGRTGLWLAGAQKFRYSRHWKVKQINH